MNRITMCVEEDFGGKVIGSFDLSEYAESIRADERARVIDEYERN